MKKRGNCLFLLILFVFLLIGSANAANDTQINKTKAYDWLNSQMISSSWNRNVDEVALSVLALGSESYNISEGIDKLRELEYSGHNWGDIRDTSLAVMALYNSGENVDQEIEWLKTQYVLAFIGGNWFVQVDSDYDGTCELHHEQTDIYHSFTVNDSQISSECGTFNWIDFEDCISLVGIDEDIEVSCELSGTYSPSLIYQASGEYYLFDQGRNLDIENGCFLSNQGDCNCEYSGYGAWILDKLGEETFVNPYLKFKCPQNTVRNSFLYILSDSSSSGPYSTWLKQAQWPDGSWGTNEGNPGEEYSTALALLALKESGSSNSANIADAARWFASKQNQDGSWDNNVENTAFILYVLYGKAYVPVIGEGSECEDGYVEGDEDCEYDYHCNEDLGEICTSGCKCILGNETTENGTLPPFPVDPCGDGFCDKLDGESCDTCFLDCSDDCGAGEGESEGEGEGEEEGCSSDNDCLENERCNPATKRCEEKSSWLKWLVAILAILLGVAIFYYIYMRYFSKKGSKPKPSSSKQSPKSQFPFKVTKQNVPIKKPPGVAYAARRDTKLEKELEVSLKKAKDILKK
jgi:hypothetical protein